MVRNETRYDAAEGRERQANFERALRWEQARADDAARRREQELEERALTSSSRRCDLVCLAVLLVVLADAFATSFDLGPLVLVSAFALVGSAIRFRPLARSRSGSVQGR